MKCNFQNCVIVLLLYATNVAGQIPFHYQFNISEGMPSSEIYDIDSDSKNNIWITTDRGICKYDGYSIETFTTEDGLDDNTNFKIYIDSKDEIWLAGFNKSISKIDKKIIHPHNANSELRELFFKEGFNWIQTFSQDTLNNNFFTVNKSENPVVIVENNNELKLFDPYTRHEPLFEVNECNFLTRIGDDYIFFHELIVYNFHNLHASKAHSLLNGLIFFGQSKIYLVDSDYKLIHSLDLGVRIQSLFVDSRDRTWVCANDGLYLFDTFFPEAKPIKFFENILISCIHEDFEGNYWIGTNDKGLYMIPSFDMKVGISNSNLLSKQKIISMTQFDNKLLFGTINSSIIKCDSNLNVEKFDLPITSKKGQVNFIDNPNDVQNIQLFAGLYFTGSEIKREDRSSISRKYSFSRKFKLNNGDWVFTTRNGFIVYSLDDGVTSFIIVDSEKIIRRLVTIAQDENDSIYFGTMDGLIKVVDYDYNNAIEIKDDNDNRLKRISDVKVVEDIIWITTIGNGVFTVKNNSSIAISDKVMLSSVMVNQVLVTNDSILWFATNSGIDVFHYSWEDSLKIKFVKNLKSSDGIPSNYINDLEFWNGYIWAATNNGICRFDPELINRAVPQIPIYITNFENQDSTYSLDQDLTFGYDQNDILISYSGLSFKQQNNQIQYKYRLIRDGQSDQSQWYFTEDRNQRFNDLIPGDYRFEVNAENALRVWNDNPANISFTIKPHFTQTLLFKTLVGLCVLFTGFFIYRYQVNRIKKKEQNEKELAEAKQKTQEAELAAIRNQMNPHFVYNSLNSIQNLIFKNDKEGANRYMSKFAKLMRQSLQFTRLDFIDLEKEFEFLNNYLDLEALRFPGKFKAIFKISEEVIASRVLIPSLILQPIVENSIKHGFNNIEYEGIITIEADLVDQEFVQLIVSDNGKGALSKTNSSGNKEMPAFHESIGTQLVKTRLDLLNEAEFKGEALMEEIVTIEGYTTKIRLPLIFTAK